MTLAVALLAGVAGLGGIVGARAQALAYETANAQAAKSAKLDAYGAEWERRYRDQQAPNLSTRDTALLHAGRDWEARYRVIYPSSR